MRISCDVLGGHTFVFQLSLRWHFQLLTPRVPLICPIRGNECVFLFQEKFTNSPRHNATHQHHSASAQPATNNRKPTTTTATNNNTATTTTTIINNQQQMHSHKNSNNSSHSNSGNTQHQTITATTVPSSCVPGRTFFRIGVRVLRTKKSKAAATTAATIKLRHMASNSMETPSQRQMTQVRNPRLLAQNSNTHVRHTKTVVVHQ